MSALAILGGLQAADALQGTSGPTSVSAEADPTPDAVEPAGEPGNLEPDYSSSFAEDGPAARSSFAAAEVPPSGVGWKSGGAKGLMPTGYTFKFRDQRAADWLGQYVRPIAAQLSQITSIPFAVQAAPVGSSYVRAPGDVVVHLYSRPCKAVSGTGIATHYVGVTDGSGAQGYACGFNWYRNWLVQSGEVWLNTDHFNATGGPASTMSLAGLKNLIAHEMGHSLGLAHANRSAAERDCAVGTNKELPVMCRPSTAYLDRAAGRYVQQFDLQGLRTLAAYGGAKPPPQGALVGIGGKCLDVKSGLNPDRTQIQLYRCNGTDAQRWILNADGSINALGKCLDNAGNVNKNGNRIQLYTCNGTPAQKWTLNAAGQIVNVATGKVVDVKGATATDGAIVHLYAPHTGLNQKWKLAA